MTTFTGPLNVKNIDAETTVVEISQGGSARFSDAVRVSGGLQVSTVSAETINVSGPVSAGGDIRVSGKVFSQGGAAVYESTVTVPESAAAGVTAAVVPAGSTIIGMTILNKTAFGTAGATLSLLIGDSTDDNVFGSVTNVSSSSVFSFSGITGVCGQALVDLAAETNVIVRVTATSGAAGAGAKIATVTWRKA